MDTTLPRGEELTDDNEEVDDVDFDGIHNDEADVVNVEGKDIEGKDTSPARDTIPAGRVLFAGDESLSVGLGLGMGVDVDGKRDNETEAVSQSEEEGGAEEEEEEFANAVVVALVAVAVEEEDDDGPVRDREILSKAFCARITSVVPPPDDATVLSLPPALTLTPENICRSHKPPPVR